MDIVNRALVRSLAASIVKLEQEKGKQYTPSSVVDVWNTEYDLVEDEDLSALQTQVTFEVEAERNAARSSFKVSKLGMTKLKMDELSGNLSPSPSTPDGFDPA
ncbi:conserved hypothetical protein [Dickeya chrysanthemi Ech1591]|uniref:Uncharacterized protein n=1 Tax=Dickeya chrysanthemi (strain Ech1591) TaxID=561229 RepID=C6CIB8_DICC1|nr:hypothetical protein [Dickeya chrysanthemi]ACT06966.1 conserved hypothetical protein [Dickeya chrysanthemi Ech1591]ACT07481.1 conserved hypothetical protein [Dickeya chrysanthemi Ech1591]